MKILSFIRQRSFARFIMVDLAVAARQVGWNTQWLDLEGVLYANANQPSASKLRVIGETVVAVERFNPDLVFSYGFEYLERVFRSFVPAVDTRFRDVIGRPAVYFVCDFGFPFGETPEHVVPEYVIPLQHWNSLVLCWDREATAALRQAGLSRALHMPLGVNEAIFGATSDAARTTPLLFVGGPSPERRRTLEAVATRGLVIHGYDPGGWAESPTLSECYAGQILDRDRLRTAYQQAAISINVTRPHGPSSLNMRVFEAMACGSLVLTDDRSDASRLFAPDREIVVYQNPSDLANKVDHYLTHPDARQAIADAGRRRVLASHTYASRLRSLQPAIDQFHRECRALSRLETLVADDPTMAVRVARDLEQKGSVEVDVENLRLLAAKAYLALGDTRRASAYLRDVEELNPRHLEAAALAHRLRHAA